MCTNVDVQYIKGLLMLLNDNLSREGYIGTHSVMLAMFACDSGKAMHCGTLFIGPCFYMKMCQKLNLVLNKSEYIVHSSYL